MFDKIKDGIQHMHQEQDIIKEQGEFKKNHFALYIWLMYSVSY